MKGGYTSFNSFIPTKMRLQVLWGVIGFTIKLSQTLKVFFFPFFFFKLAALWWSQEATAVTVGAEIFLYLDC